MSHVRVWDNEVEDPNVVFITENSQIGKGQTGKLSGKCRWAYLESAHAEIRRFMLIFSPSLS